MKLDNISENNVAKQLILSSVNKLTNGNTTLVVSGRKSPTSKSNIRPLH